MDTARVGDTCIGTCTCHKNPVHTSGTLVTGAGTVLAGGQAVSRLGDMVVMSCGHTAAIIGASTTVLAEGQGVARVGDPVGSGCVVEGTVVTGLSTVQTN